MTYKDYLKTLQKCPFCDLHDRENILETDKCILTYALAPYHRHHLLIIPKRHCLSILALDPQEKSEIDTIQSEAIKILKNLGHTSFSIMVREGNDSGRSVAHLHYHVIPDISLGSSISSGIDREVLDRDEQAKIYAELKSVLSN